MSERYSKSVKLEDMPNEVLEKIFHKLSVYDVQHNLALVSKQFLKVSRIPGMVNYVKIIIGPGNINNVYRKTNKSDVLPNKFSEEQQLEQFKIDFEKEKNLCFVKARGIIKVHPTANIELKYLDGPPWEGEERSYLLYAAKEQNMKTDIDEVNFLLDHMMIDPIKNICDGDGTTPLHFSAYHGKMEITKMLLQYEPTWVKVRDNFGWTPIHYAVCLNSGEDLVKLIALLLEYDADINALNDNNDTPLHMMAKLFARGQNNFTEIKMFLENGALIDIRNGNRKQTPLDIIKEAMVETELKEKLINLFENQKKKLI